MNAQATPFREQHRLQAWLLHGDAAIAGAVQGEDRAPRLRIYADAYRLRLIEVLGNDFPVLRAWLGEDGFAASAAGYLDAYPSTQPSVRHFGRHFANWLQTQGDAAPGCAELARFEWAQGEVFDAADAPAASLAAVAALPAAAWPHLRLHLQPALRLLPLCGNAPALAAAHAAGEPLPAYATNDGDMHWLLWRCDFDVHWRRLPDDEADALQAVQRGARFGQLCLHLAQAHGDAAALRAAGLLKRWLADGIVAALATEPLPSHPSLQETSP